MQIEQKKRDEIQRLLEVLNTTLNDAADIAAELVKLGAGIHYYSDRTNLNYLQGGIPRHVRAALVVRETFIPVSGNNNEHPLRH